MENYICLNQVVSYSVHINVEHDYIRFNKKKSKFQEEDYGITRGSYWKNIKNLTYTSILEKIKNHHGYYDEINKIVYYLPHIDFTMSNGNARTLFFESEDKLREFLNHSFANPIKL